jgi:phenylpyruvate tautomerase PptA (4-oxalocrotonate tautomerase family)
VTPGIEIVGGAGEYEAAAIVAAVTAIMAEEEARARQLTTTSRWKVELEEFRPGRWGVGDPAGAPRPRPPD